MSYQSKLKQIREYRVWTNIKTRCFNPRVPAYPRYGGRGITICDRWRDSFKAFLEDMGPCPPGLTIERVNNDGNYEPTNCIWASPKQQCQNRIGLRLIDGLTLTEYARRAGITEALLRGRLNRGIPLDEAIDPRSRVLKLTAERVSEIRRRVVLGCTHQQLATEFGVDRSTVTAVTCGKNWKHVQEDLPL